MGGVKIKNLKHITYFFIKCYLCYEIENRGFSFVVM